MYAGARTDIGTSLDRTRPTDWAEPTYCDPVTSGGQKMEKKSNKTYKLSTRHVTCFMNAVGYCVYSKSTP